MSDRYEKFRALAVTDPSTLTGKSLSLYHVYCLGETSCVTEYVVENFTIKTDNGIGPLFNYKYTDMPNVQHQYLGDCGMSNNNCNQHLVFLDKETALEYAKACREDPEECADHKWRLQQADWLDSINDDYTDEEYNDFETEAEE